MRRGVLFYIQYMPKDTEDISLSVNVSGTSCGCWYITPSLNGDYFGQKNVPVQVKTIQNINSCFS